MTTDTLDITSFKEHGQELAKAIERAVKDTQSVIIRDYPYKLLMTLDQYKELEHDPDLLEAYSPGTKEFLPTERIWQTKYNVMEVLIK